MNRQNTILAVFVLCKFLLQYHLISPEYDLHRDEYLHLDQANHLAWGYSSVPPVTSWISLLIKLLGGSVFWVKFFPALFGALTMVVVWKTTEVLKGNLFAQCLASLGVLLSVLLRVNTLYQPNSLDILCWTGTYFVVIKYLDTPKSKWLYVTAAVFAIGFLNKYNIVFLLLGLLPALICSPERKLLYHKHLYLAAVLGLLLVLPNLIWQYQHDFPVQKHLKELSKTQLIHVNMLDFLKSQVLFFLGSFFVIILGLYALGRFEPFKKYRVFLWTFPFTLGIFMYFKAKDYYAIGLYPVYLAFGAVFLDKILQDGWKRYLQPIALLCPIIVFIPIYDVAFPNRSPEYIVNHPKKYKALGLLRWEDGRDHALPQDFADMLAWQELATKVDKAYKNISKPGKTLILCDNYGQAGAVNFYGKLNIDAVSFNADYIDWMDLSLPYSHVIRVINSREKKEEFPQTSTLFDTAFISDSITNPYAREQGAAICVFLNAKVDVNEIIQEEVNKVKSSR